MWCDEGSKVMASKIGRAIWRGTLDNGDVRLGGK